MLRIGNIPTLWSWPSLSSQEVSKPTPKSKVTTTESTTKEAPGGMPDTGVQTVLHPSGLSRALAGVRAVPFLLLSLNIAQCRLEVKTAIAEDGCRRTNVAVHL